MGKSLALVYGVPIGIFVGAVVGASLQVADVDNGGAIGLLSGFVSGAMFGLGLGRRSARTNYEWIQTKRTLVPNTEWDAVVMALNFKAAKEHHLMLRREKDYVAYVPTLATPVAAGPLTVSGQYLSVIVARLDATTITFTGPRYMVDAFLTAATEAGAIVPPDLSEQAAHAAP